MEAHKPSFLSSVMSGIKGYFKGFLAGGIVGVISGAAVGAVVGLLTGGTGAAAAAVVGAKYGAVIMGGAGAMAGTMTEVVRTREAGQVSAEDLVGIAKVSYAQGIGVGHQVAQAEQTEAGQTRFRDKVMKERAQAAQQTQQLH